MKQISALLGVLMLGWACEAKAVEARDVLPAPANAIVGHGRFHIEATTMVTYRGAILKPVANLLATDLGRQLGRSMHCKRGGDGKRAIHLAIVDSHSPLLAAHTTYGVSAAAAKGVDERYRLKVDTQGISIVGATAAAVYRGCATLRQMVGVTGKDDQTIAAAMVQDAPDLAWRGLSLDVSRCFINAEEVKQVIDMMALYKMNVLHLHLNDNQGWRIEIKAYPELTEKGGFVENSGRKGGYITQEEYKDIVAFAARRFITVIPEIDLPGHSSAIFKTYPSAVNIAKLPFDFNLPGQALAGLDAEDEPTMQMVETIFREISAITPGRFIHIGSDETFGMPDDKYAIFVKRIRSYVKRVGKEIVGWQEMARAEVSDGDIIQNWISFSKKQMLARKKKPSDSKSFTIPNEVSEYLGRTYLKAPQDITIALKNKAKILLSPSAYCYIDCPYEEESTDLSQKLDRDRLGLQQYVRQNLKDMYEWSPISYNTQCNWKSDIAGVEGAIWGESIENFKDMQFLLLPRLTSIAEKGWGASRQTSWEDYRHRLSFQSSLWDYMKWYFFRSSMINWK